MELTLYQVDAFTNRVFAGNPAAICPLEAWLEPSLMQAIASENNLSETAFFVKAGDHYELRWFTPTLEVELCGHATLASAYILLNHLSPESEVIHFETKSGRLTVQQQGDLLVMDFPALPVTECENPGGLFEALGTDPKPVFSNERDYMVVYDSEAEVHALQPNMFLLQKLDRRAVMATAPGDQVDFVSRFFAPKAGIPEDPVTGSAHCLMTPYWSQRLEKESLHAVQISPRRGDLFCKSIGDRVELAGYATLYLQGRIWV